MISRWYDLVFSTVAVRKNIWPAPGLHNHWISRRKIDFMKRHCLLCHSGYHIFFRYECFGIYMHHRSEWFWVFGNKVDTGFTIIYFRRAGSDDFRFFWCWMKLSPLHFHLRRSCFLYFRQQGLSHRSEVSWYSHLIQLCVFLSSASCFTYIQQVLVARRRQLPMSLSFRLNQLVHTIWPCCFFIRIFQSGIRWSHFGLSGFLQ